MKTEVFDDKDAFLAAVKGKRARGAPARPDVPRAPRGEGEHVEQVALFEWAAWNQGKDAALNMLYAIPNGGKRDKAVAGKLRAEGVKAGVPDVFLPVARMGYHGLYIEMKVDKNKPTARQREWLSALSAEGYMVDVSYSWAEAAHKIVRYLGKEPKEFGL